MNGYTQTIDRETKRHNELHATVEIVIANPDNKFWQNRLAAVRDNIDTDHLAELVDICNTDPAHILNTETEADWLQADNAAALYGDAIVDRMNDRAGYDLFGAMARKTPERVAWEQEYLKKREAETAKRRKERR